MSKSNFTITLADGTQLGGLEMNGNNFVSKMEVTADTFRGKLGRVVITGEAEYDQAGLLGEHLNMELIQIAHYTQKKHGLIDGWYFVLKDIPAEKLERIQNRADLEYLAMMAGVEL